MVLPASSPSTVLIDCSTAVVSSLSESNSLPARGCKPHFGVVPQAK